MNKRLAENNKLLIQSGILAVLGILLFFYVKCFQFALIDDTYITLQYARTLAESHTWGFYADQETNTATSPLNVVLTALCSLAAPTPVDAAIWLGAAELAVMFIFLVAISKKLFNSYYFAAAAFLIIASSPLIISTIGLESLLYSTLIAASLAFFLYKKQDALAISLALLTMTRPDGALLFIVFFLLLEQNRANAEQADDEVPLFSFLWRARLRLFAIYIFFLAPWELFSWLHFHSLLPYTLSIKTSQGSHGLWGNWKFSNGIYLYLKSYPVAAAYSFMVLALMAFALVKTDRLVKNLMAVLLLFGVLNFCGYSFLGVPPYHWYYVPLLVNSILIGTLGASSLFHSEKHSVTWRFFLMALPILFTTNMAFFLIHENFLPKQAPIHTNWATAETYKRIGIWMKDNIDSEARIKLSGEIGTLAYYSRLHLIDVFSCRQDCIQPFSYRLEMYNRELDSRAAKASIIKEWPIDSTWVSNGKIVLKQ